MPKMNHRNLFMGELMMMQNHVDKLKNEYYPLIKQHWIYIY